MSSFLLRSASALFLSIACLSSVSAQPATVPVPTASGMSQVPQSEGQIKLTFAPLVKETAPAVVNVYAAREVATRSPFAGDPFFEQFLGRSFQGRPRMESSLGSGVIVDETGLVVTNNHVVDGADEVKIALGDGREYASTVLMKDARADLAVLRIDADETFSTIAFSDSDQISIGDLVLAIGNPFGIGQTVTSGIVSALARTHVGVNDFGYFIQTDAAINPGNSGGPLIDMQGRLIGVNTAIFSRSGGSNGIGFAIPSNMVRVFVDAAKRGGRFERPYIGAGFAPVTGDIAEALGMPRPTGALVQEVVPDGAAADAGLKPGDVVMRMDDFLIDGPDALGYRLATIGVDKTARLTILSGGQERMVDLALRVAPETPARDERTIEGNNPFSGATVANLSPRVADELEMPTTKRGVVVTGIGEGSIAARLRLQQRDIVLEVNGEAVDTTEKLATILDMRSRGWNYAIERNGQRLTQSIR
ncbi:Do/DeqQ family serine protease [Aureimonas altamirensis DSM 21988]|uniref:Do/DeqQ family serine protease n=2 Tax=Aureimonas altamirensis TaxID=370622 RepID=A0ABY1I4K1_9HYPH|nr:Do/DeqQ family serine protease [Aureimonas altamirensis DSM 21988]